MTASRARPIAARGLRRADLSVKASHDLGSDVVVVALCDDTLRQAIHDLRWRLGEVLEQGPSTLVVDVSQVRRLSAATIAVLLWVKRRCRARGVRIILRDPSRGSLDVLRRSGLQSTLEIEQGVLRPVAGTPRHPDGPTKDRS